jgi:cytochrome P450
MTTATSHALPACASSAACPWSAACSSFAANRLAFQQRVADAGITRTRIAWRTLYVITDHELAHEVLVERDDAFIKGPGLAVVAKPLLGDGLLTSEKDAHRRARKLLAPAFTPKRMVGYAEVMAACAARHLAAVRPGAMIDLAEAMMTTTLDIVGRTLFDADLTGDAGAIGDALTEAMEYVLATVLSPIPLGWPTPGRRRGLAAVARLDEVVLRLIGERRAAGGDRGDVLSIVLAARDDDGVGLSDRHVRDEIMTLMLAGHETTANLLAWTWSILATQPEVAARLHAELDAVLGRPSADLRRSAAAPGDPGDPRGDAAPLPAGPHHRPPGRPRRHHRRRRHRRRQHRHDLGPRDAAPRRVLGRPADLPPRPLPRRRSQGAPPRLPAVRRRAAGVHRQPLRAHRGPAHPRHLGPALHLAPGPAGAHRARGPS